MVQDRPIIKQKSKGSNDAIICTILKHDEGILKHDEGILKHDEGILKHDEGILKHDEGTLKHSVSSYLLNNIVACYNYGCMGHESKCE